MRHTKRCGRRSPAHHRRARVAGCSAGGRAAADAASCAPSDGAGHPHLHLVDPRHRGRRRRSGTTRTPTSRSRSRPARTATAARTRTSSTSSRPATRPTSARSSTTRCPNFRVQDGLENLAACEASSQAEDQFVDWTWSQVDARRPTTRSTACRRTPARWRCSTAPTCSSRTASRSPRRGRSTSAAAEKIRAAGGYITNFSQSDINQFAGLAWQAGGRWFGNDGDAVDRRPDRRQDARRSPTTGRT